MESRKPTFSSADQIIAVAGFSEKEHSRRQFLNKIIEDTFIGDDGYYSWWQPLRWLVKSMLNPLIIALTNPVQTTVVETWQLLSNIANTKLSPFDRIE